MAYDKKYRKRAIEYYEAGNNYKETCEIFKISSTTLANWLSQYRKDGSFDFKKSPGRPALIDPDELEKYLEEKPDCYQAEIASAFSCSTATVCQSLKRYSITRKKDHTLQRTRCPKSSGIS